jgi:hypothetical protein
MARDSAVTAAFEAYKRSDDADVQFAIEEAIETMGYTVSGKEIVFAPQSISLERAAEKADGGVVAVTDPIAGGFTGLAASDDAGKAWLENNKACSTLTSDKQTVKWADVLDAHPELLELEESAPDSIAVAKGAVMLGEESENVHTVNNFPTSRLGDACFSLNARGEREIAEEYVCHETEPGDEEYEWIVVHHADKLDY